MNTESSLSVVLAGGGTAGHISPLLAIAHALREARPGVRLLAVGTPGGMEARLVPAAGAGPRHHQPGALPAAGPRWTCCGCPAGWPAP